MGVSPSTCLARVRALVADGVITRFTVDVDPDAFGEPLQALVSVRLRPGERHQRGHGADRSSHRLTQQHGIPRGSTS